MARIIRLKMNWTGFVGGPGYTNMHFEPVAGGDISQAIVNDARDILQTWITSWRPNLPTPVSVGIDPNVQEIDENHGNIEAFWTTTVAAPTAGTTSGSYAGGAGACVNWYTDGVWNGRRVRGRTFLVPMGNSTYDSDGTLTAGALGAWRAATATFIAASNLARLVVWRRPSDQPLLINGGAYDVNSYSINDKVAILRSRRD
jgi:hypothetical protein